MDVMIDGSAISIASDVFDALLDNSVVSTKAGVRNAREKAKIQCDELLDLAREAEIPYPLFFAPIEVVESQLRTKKQKLMAGFTARDFSMNSRHHVNLCDIELIVKDLLRKQQYLRQDAALPKNKLVNAIRTPGRAPFDDAKKLSTIIGLDVEDLRQTRSKEAALEVLIKRLEESQVMVSRSAQHWMPQRLPDRAKFSGITIKDTKVPFIFLASGEGGERRETSGRKVFTLTLLAVLIGRGTFAPVTYDDQITEAPLAREYAIAAEILMPAKDLRAGDLRDLTAIQEMAEKWKVTPSAVVIRGRKLGIIEPERFERHMADLAAIYADLPRPHMNPPLTVNALRKYNGTECSRRMLALLDSGGIGATDFCRVMFANKLNSHEIEKFRAAVR